MTIINTTIIIIKNGRTDKAIFGEYRVNRVIMKTEKTAIEMLIHELFIREKYKYTSMVMRTIVRTTA